MRPLPVSLAAVSLALLAGPVLELEPAAFRTGLVLLTLALLPLGRRLPGLAWLPLLLLGPALRPAASPDTWALWAGAILLGPWVLARLPLALTGLGATALLAALLLTFFPPGTWADQLLADDYPTVLYNTLRDLEALRAGGLGGWDHAVEGGRPLILSLRTLAPLFLPLAPLGAGAALHGLILLSVLVFPLAALAACRPFGLSRAAAWTGAVLFFWVPATTLLRHGMLYSLVALDLLLVELVALERLRAGRAGGGVVLGAAVALGAYVHAAQQALALPLLAATWRRGGRTLPVRPLLGAVCLAGGLAFPYAALLWEHRDLLQPSHVLGTVPAFAQFARAGPAGTAVLVAERGLWEFPGPFRFAFVLLPVALARAAGMRRFLALILAPLLFLWVPGVGLALLRYHILAVGILALVTARLLTLLPPPGRGVLLAGLLVGLGFRPETDLAPQPLYSAADLATAEPELTALVASLPGHRVLFENGGSNNPFRDLVRPYEPYPGTECHRAGALVLATGRDLFAHAGWDVHPYHRLRDAYLVNGAYEGEALTAVSSGRFEAALKRYGVATLVVWSRAARAYLESRPDRYRFLFAVPPRREPVLRPGYRVYRFLEADPRSVRVRTGGATLVDRGPFHYTVAVTGARSGETVTLAARYLPGWSVVVGGERFPSRNDGGLLAARLPREGAQVLRFEYDRRWRYGFLGLVLAGLGLLGLFAGRRP